MARTHNRRLGLSGVALTKQRNNRFEIAALTNVRNRVETILDEDHYLQSAPFSWVTLVIRYGLRDADVPEYRPINAKYGDLPLSIEIDTRGLVAADQAALEAIFQRATLVALIHAGKRYGLPICRLEEQLALTASPPASAH